MIKIIALVLVALVLDVKANCWKSSYGRGAGVPLSECRSGEELSGLLCYPVCRQGYYGVGPVCWESCKSSYADHGAICWRNAHIFGNGCTGRCPEGYKNDGCTCRRDVHSYAKNSYGRGAGSPMTCRSDEQQDGGLCYSSCKQGYYGVGPVCWKYCSGDYSTDCGAFCSSSVENCTTTTATFVAMGLDAAQMLVTGQTLGIIENGASSIITSVC